MKGSLVIVLAILAVAHAAQLPPVDLSAYDYHNKVGNALAAVIRAQEDKDVATRIVGGSAAELGQYPFQIGLVITLSNGFTSVCGASLLTATRALTAAHCWWDGVNQARQFTVVAGSTRLFFGGTRVTTSDVAMHSGWAPTELAHDIAIIRFSPISFNDIIGPIALPSGEELHADLVGDKAVASGYGITGDNSLGISILAYLSHVDLQVIKNSVCQETFGTYIRDTIICTSGAGGTSTCSGDSGGPLSVEINGQRVLIGVVSFGAAAGCTQGFPAAFSRVSEYVPWIQQHLQ